MEGSPVPQVREDMGDTSECGSTRETTCTFHGEQRSLTSVQSHSKSPMICARSAFQMRYRGYFGVWPIMSFGLVPRDSRRGASAALRLFVAVVFALRLSPNNVSRPLHSAAHPLFFIDAPQVGWAQPFLLLLPFPPPTSPSDPEQSRTPFQAVITTPNFRIVQSMLLIRHAFQPGEW